MNVSDIIVAHQVAYRDALLEAWARRTGHMDRHGFMSYRPEDVPAYITVPTNEERSRAEVARFKLRPLQHGKSYTAYLSRDDELGGFLVTTFTGDTLATVDSMKTRKYPRGVMSNQIGAFKATGIDGRRYVGNHNGVGMHCTMRLAK